MAADDTERLFLEMSANLKSFENSLDRANATANRRFDILEKRALKASTAIERTFGDMGSGIRTALAGIGVGLAIKEVARYSDAWTSSANKLAAAGVEAEKMVSTQSRLVDLANETRSSYESTADLYAKINRATASLGANELQVARAVETVNKALASGGASASERDAAILQLGQGLSSGILAGDELKSIRENSSVLAKAIADEFNTTVGGLKKLGAEGKLTADRVFLAILKGSQAVDAQFAKTTPTIADSFTILENSAVRFIGQLNAATGAAAATSAFIVHVADNLDLLTQAAIIAGGAVGGVLVARGLATLATQGIAAARAVGFTTTAITAMGLRATAANAGIASLRAGMAFLGGPLGVAIAATSVALGFYAASMAKASVPSEKLGETTGALTAALGDYEKAALLATLQTGKEGEAARSAAEEKRKLVIRTREAAQAKLDEARATLALLQAEQARRLDFAEQSGAAADQGSVAGAGLINLMQAPKVRQLQTDAKAAADAIKNANAQIEAVNAALKGPGLKTTPTTAAAGKGSKKDPIQERADIAAAIALEAARLAGDVDRTRELEKQVDLAAQVKKYEETGLQTAEARRRAASDMATLEDARTAAADKALVLGQQQFALELARIREEFDGVRTLERRAELLDRIKALQEQGLDLASATVAATSQQLEVDRARAAVRAKFLRDSLQEQALNLARLRGDTAHVRALERELAIRERSKELQEQGGLGKSQADATATSEQIAVDVAALRGQFRGAFRDGVRAAITGDLGAYFADLGADVADKVLGRSLDVLADSLLDTLAAAVPKLFDIGADLVGDTAGAAAMSAAITAAGAGAGATMGTAIVAASGTAAGAVGASITVSSTTAAATLAAGIVAGGAQAAAMLAASIAGGSAGGSAAAAAFAGFRASGGPYMIANERGPEGYGSTGGHGVVFSTAAMRGLADLGRLAKQGQIGGGGSINLEVVNNGPPAAAKVEKSPSGDMKLTLEPIFNQALDSAGQSGRLERSLRRRPRAKTRG